VILLERGAGAQEVAVGVKFGFVDEGGSAACEELADVLQVRKP
jgi:hypothetical protein